MIINDSRSTPRIHCYYAVLSKYNTIYIQLITSFIQVYDYLVYGMIMTSMSNSLRTSTTSIFEKIG
jgi:hypothetical protein